MRKNGLKHILPLATLLLVWIGVTQGVCLGAEYYVDEVKGKDSNPGTSELPWATMERAMSNWSGAGDKVGFGDTVYLHSGNYGDVEFTYPPPSPLPASWDDAITYKAEDGQAPVFSYLYLYNVTPRYLEFDGIDVVRPDEEIASGHSAIYSRGPSSVRLKNMNIVGHWDTVVNGRLTFYGIRINTVMVGDSISDILIENCNITNTGQGISFQGGVTGSGIIIKNNTIHHTSNSAIIIGSRSRIADADPIIIEHNYIYGAGSAIEYYTISHNNSVSGTFNNNERVTQDITGAIGRISSITTSNVRIAPLTDAWLVGDGYDIVGDFTGARLSDPIAITHTEMTHASGIGLTTDNVIVRNNVIRNYAATSPLHTYPGWITFAKDGHRGYSNVTIENNLVYDPWSANPTLLEELNSNNIIRHNTFVGYHLVPSNQNGYYYRAALNADFVPESTGNQIYGNIVVGIADFASLYPIVAVNQETKTFSIAGDYRSQFLNGAFVSIRGGSNTGWYNLNGDSKYDGTNTNIVVVENIGSPNIGGSFKKPVHSDSYDEDYNIFFSVINGGRWTSSLKGDNTQILSDGQTYPQTFESDFFVKPNYTYEHGQVCDYRLQSEALAVNFGNSDYAPATDILGVSRDSSPDAGCYEYTSSTPPPPIIYGDVNGNGEVTSYDAALAARYAVGLETFTDEQRQKADVSGNGAVSAYDAALIAQRAVGLIDRFPVEE